MAVYIYEKTTKQYVKNFPTTKDYKLVEINDATDYEFDSVAQLNIEAIENLYPQLQFEIIEKTYKVPALMLLLMLAKV